MFSRGGLAGALVLGWCALSLVWTPFLAEASERLLNILSAIVLAAAGYLALPDRMRSANLYILPVGVAVGALCAMPLAFLDPSAGLGGDDDLQNLERGLIVLVLFMWPAVAWLRSRGRDVEALCLAVAVALASLVSPHFLPLDGLAAGAVVFAIAAKPALRGVAHGGRHGGPSPFRAAPALRRSAARRVAPWRRRAPGGEPRRLALRRRQRAAAPRHRSRLRNGAARPLRRPPAGRGAKHVAVRDLVRARRRRCGRRGGGALFGRAERRARPSASRPGVMAAFARPLPSPASASARRRCGGSRRSRSSP